MNVGVIWALPIPNNKEYISSNAKYHCYEEGNALCGKRYRNGGDETEIEHGEILSNPQFACKVCYKRWKRKFNILDAVHD